MRFIAILAVVALVVVPLAACGSSGGSADCLGACQVCSSSADCCGEFGCNVETSDGFPRCESFTLQCKLAP